MIRFKWSGYLQALLDKCTITLATITGATISSSTITSSSLAGTNVTATGNFGYATGAGGAVTQLTDKTTGVTLNKRSGAITTHDNSLAAGAEVSFTLTNSTIAATDVVVVCIKSGGTAGAYNVVVDAVAAGSCQISLTNLSTGALGEALVLNFAVIKAVAA